MTDRPAVGLPPKGYAMRTSRLIALAALVSVTACQPVPINDYVSPTPVVSTAPASVQVLVSSRSDQRLDVSAVVLTAARVPVTGAVVTFSASNGTLTSTSVATDSNGYARSIASANWNNTISATVAGISDSFKVIGVAPVVLPLAPSISAPSIAFAGDSVSFGVNLPSSGSDVSVVRWTFGDGASTTANTFTPSHRYSAAGNYTVTLDVADSLGRSAQASTRVSVSAAPVIVVAPPVAINPVTVSIVCTAVTPSRRSCTGTPMYNGAAVATSLVASMVVEWGDNASEGMIAAVASSHTYPLGQARNYVVKVYGSLTTGETFIGQVTISVG